MQVHLLKYLMLVQEDCITDGARSEHSEHHSKQHICLQEWHINGMSPNSRCVAQSLELSRLSCLVHRVQS